MCFDTDSLPPIPDNGDEVACRDLVLESDDGNRFAAFESMPGGEARAAVVVLPDVRGLFRFYRELAVRLAQHGAAAVAIDYFGRTAGAGPRDDDFEFKPHVDQMTFAGVTSDVAAAVDHLGEVAPAAPLYTVGFCLGGSLSWHQAANGLGLAGAVGFYGHPNRPGVPREAPAVISRVGDMDCPILALMGGADPGIPPEEVDAFDEALDSAGVSREVFTYPGAPHSFFDRKAAEFAAESADAWERIVAFMRLR